MKLKIFKSTTSNLVILFFVVIASFSFTTMLFNSKIDKLQNQIDDIYFGNLMPVVKLHKILDNYRTIIHCRTIRYVCNFKKEKSLILKDWTEYSSLKKTEEEKQTIKKLDAKIKKSFKINKLHKFKNILNEINDLISVEIKQALKKKDTFTQEQQKIRDYLFYNILFILSLAFVFILYIIFQVINKDKQLRILNEKFRIDSITDNMTKLYNRKYFDKIFDSMPFISNQENWESAFIMVDIDFFKQYNDTYGHDAGDQTLIKVAALLKEYFSKKYEYVFRLGGEEFGIILYDINEEIIKACLSDINQRVVDLNIEHRTSKVLDVVSISIGAVIYEPKSYVSGNKLYRKADECLYKSKQNGRNCYHITKGK